MQTVYTHKALSNRVMLFGLLPLDVVVILISTLMLWGTSNSFTAAFLWISLVTLFFKKMKYRSHRYFRSLITFIVTSPKMSIKFDDIKPYRNAICPK
jgi:hypothetical protein